MNLIPILDLPGLPRSPHGKLDSKEDFFRILHHRVDYQLLGFEGIGSISCNVLTKEGRSSVLFQVFSGGCDDDDVNISGARRLQ